MDNREFFNKLAFEWDSRCKHDEEKIKKIIEISCIKESSKILDVGTGTGILVRYLLESSPEKIIAVDIAENMIEVAKSKFNDSRVEFIAEDILKFEEGEFDYIFIYSAYPHFKNKDVLFKHLCDRLNVGGKIIIAHSQSKEEINKIHAKKEYVKDDVLPAAEVTAKIMSRYFKINKLIDNKDMYYILGVK